ncbi:MAG: exosortase/archaeosortase family protein [Candidatus Bathyarchaeales archaeon]
MEKLKETFKKAKFYSQHILAVSLITLLILVVYWRDLEILANEALTTEALSHAILIPFFLGFLLYHKKDMFTASLALDKLHKKPKIRFVDELVGLSLCLIALLLYWYGSYTFYPLTYHLLSLPIFTTGVILILFNLKALKTIIFPLILLLFLVPIPNEIMCTAGGNLANINTQASYTALKTLGLPVTLSTAYGAPTLILTTSAGQPASFTVDLPCSGIYTLIAFTMFAFFLALIVSTSRGKKLLTFAFGFAIFEFLSIIRITTIISAAYFFGEETAMLFFHTFAGLILTFTGMLLTLLIAEKLLKVKFSPKTETTPCPKCKTAQKNLETFCSNCGRLLNSLKGKPSQKFWAKLFILLIVFPAIALSVNAPTLTVAKEQIEVTSTWENATDIFPQIPQYRLKFLYRDINYERIARQDVSLVYAYIPTNISEPVVYVLVGVADSLSNLHNWEVCLISYQTAQGKYPIVSVIDSKDIQLLEESFPLTARYLVFNTPENYTQVTLYWYEKATFKTGITVQQKYVRISLVILTYNATEYPQHEETLQNFGKTIASYWQPIKNQALISLGIPAQQTLLVLSIALITFTKTSEYAEEWRKRTNNLKIFNNFATPEDKIVFQATSELSKEKRAFATADVSTAIKNKFGKTMKLENLIERLNRLKEYGFIKQDIASNENKPKLVWKSLISL